HTRGFDNDVIEPVRPLEQCKQRRHQRIADAAAETTVRERNRVATVPSNQSAVDVERAEIVDQHAEPSTFRLREQTIEQRRLAGAEKAADDGEGKMCGHFPGASKTRPPSTVPHTPMSLSFSGAAVSGSSSRMAKSARLPTSMLPSSSSSFSV